MGGDKARRSPRQPRVDLAELEREQQRTWRRQARERAPALRERRARLVAYHEAGHAIVAAHLGLMPEQVGIEVATRFEAGAVVTPTNPSASRTRWAMVLAAGGLAEERVSGIAARGTESDESQIAGLGLSPGVVAAARRRATRLLDELWPFVEALVPLLLENRHLAGETAIFVALEAVFGADEAARRSRLVPLGCAFGQFLEPAE